MTRILAVTILAFALAAQGVTCPIDDSGAYATGETRTDQATGKLLKEYKCRRNSHSFWVPSR